MAGLGVVAAKLGLGTLTGCTPSVGRTADDLEPRAYLPLITSEEGASAVIPTPTNTPSSAILPTFTPTSTPTPTMTPTSTPTATPTPTPGTPPPTGSKVVHVDAANATSWDFSTGWYGDYVNQDVVNSMVDEGVMQLTSQSSVTAAWETILPDYSPGEGIAVKVNLNNSSCLDTDNMIDALIEPVNALVRGLKAIGVQETDIWVYDASRGIPDRFRLRCLYPGVRFFDTGACAESAGFGNTDPDAEIYFSHVNLTSRRITDLLVSASYVINMPIVKDHAGSGATLSFKNHFGSINMIVGAGEDNLHDYIYPSGAEYDPNYSPLVELYANSHIYNKTVLTVGDGLYGALGNTSEPPSRWTTFSNASPNSLFLATDAVAVDCVMLDILDSEPGWHPCRPGADDYLQLSADAGLGVFERGDPWGAGYSHIVYLKLEL